MTLRSILGIWFCVASMGLHFGIHADTIPLMKHRVILADEGNSKIHYLNLANPSEHWSADSPNRDLQLVGDNRLLVSDNFGSGYAEYDLTTGEQKKRVNINGITSGVNSAFRLSPYSTSVAVDGNPARILRIDPFGRIVDSVTLSVNASVRICRQTPQGTFILGSKESGKIAEFNDSGRVIWQAVAGGEPYMGVRLQNGNTLISNGYGGQMVLVDPQGNVIKKIPDQPNYKGDQNPGDGFWAKANPYFFAGFQILQNGNIVVANWQGHGAGHGGSGYQLLEFDSSLTKVVSYWKQDSTLVSSLHGVLVLDSLDTQQICSDINGNLLPLTSDPVGSGRVKRLLALQKDGSYYIPGTPGYPNGEATAWPQAGDAVSIDNTTYTWEFAEDYDGIWADKNVQNFVAFFGLEIFSPHDIDCKIMYVNDDDMKIWNEGRVIVNEGLWNTNEKASGLLTLKKGSNWFFIRQHGGAGYNNFGMRFVDTNGEPLTELSYKPFPVVSTAPDRQTLFSAPVIGKELTINSSRLGEHMRISVSGLHGAATVSIFDLRGTLIAQQQADGLGEITFAQTIRSGCYIVRIQSMQGVFSKKISLN